MTTLVNMHDAKTNLSALVERALNGERIVIARAGTPLVDLVPHQARQIKVGLGAGEFEFDAESFDAPDPEIAELFYGRGQ